MKKVICVYKPQGYTPLQVIDLLKKESPDLVHEKIGFAGRLDPLAHGVMLLLVGEANKNRQDYLNLPKTYQAKILLGLSTDTLDLLGYLTKEYQMPPSGFQKQAKEFLASLVGKHTQSYPLFSSKTVSGKPLFWWAKRRKLSQITIPTREIEVYSIKVLGFKRVELADIIADLQIKIKPLKGYFRQTRVIRKWEGFLQQNPNLAINLIKIEVSCSSGTYIRSIAKSLGEKLKTGALASEIYRTKVGKYNINQALLLKLKQGKVGG